jgi:hypothetical protein
MEELYLVNMSYGVPSMTKLLVSHRTNQNYIVKATEKVDGFMYTYVSSRLSLDSNVHETYLDALEALLSLINNYIAKLEGHLYNKRLDKQELETKIEDYKAGLL